MKWPSATGHARALAVAACPRRDARAAGIGFTIDAEEADRLEPSLDLVEALALAPILPAGTGSASRSRPIRSGRSRSSIGSPILLCAHAAG